MAGRSRPKPTGRNLKCEQIGCTKKYNGAICPIIGCESLLAYSF
jgi:hypothetical protein